MQLSDDARLIAGILLITVPTIEFGGVFLLRLLRNSERGYADNPLRQNLFRAGHAHAGVLVILSLVMQLLVDSLSLAAPVAWIARLGVPAAAILMPLGFFLSVLPPEARKPGNAIALVYVGALLLALSTVLLGLLLLRSTLRNG